MLALYICPGTPVVVWGDADGNQTREFAKAVRQIVVTWRWTHCLRLIREGDSHGSWVFWDESWKFLGWYINFQEPFRRNRLGIDTMDYVLDMEIWPDRQKYRWKDEGEFLEAVEFGLYRAEMLDELKTYGLRVFEQAKAGEAPFGDGWEHWRPEPGWGPVWGPVELADGWDVIFDES